MDTAKPISQDINVWPGEYIAFLPDAKRAATRHLRLLLDLTMRTLLCLLLAIKIYGRDTLQRLMADDITIRDRFHVAYDIGAAKA